MAVVPRRSLLACVFALAFLIPSAAAFATYQSTVMTDDPVVYLRMGERSGTTLANLGRHGGDAAVVGNPVLGAYGALESDTTGDRAIRLDGDDHVRLMPPPGTELRGTYTLEGWVKLDDNRYHQELFGGPSQLMIDGWRTTVWSGGWYYGLPTVGKWHHLALTVSGSQMEYFINGVSYGPLSFWNEGLAYDDAQRLTIGHGLFGYVDEVAAFDKVLTPERIAEHYRAGADGFGAPAPVVTTRPAITGAATVGSRATCSDGDWSNGPRSFTFRWLRNGAPIDRATEASYTLSADDIGRSVTCEVTAKNAAGPSDAATSSNALAIPAAAPATNYADLVLQDRPRTYLPLDDRSATAAQNRGSDGGTATVHGNPETDVYGAVESDQPSDRAYRLDGDDHLELDPQPGSRVAGAYSVEAWVKLDQHTAESKVFSGGAYLAFTRYQTLLPSYNWWTSVPAQEWRHVALTVRPDERDRRGTYEFFIDGVLVGMNETPWPTPLGIAYDDANRLRIGEGVVGTLDEIAVYDYELSRERIAEHVRRAKEGFGAGVPTSTTAPTVAGTPVVGTVASCDEGVWAGGPRDFTFRWLRAGTPIAGATERRYTLSGDDLTHDVTCRVVARNRAGESSAVTSSDALSMPADPPATSYGETVLDDNPRVYLPLDDRSGTSAQNLGSDGGTAVVAGDPDTAFYGAVESDEPSDRSYRLDGDDHLELRPAAGAAVSGTYTVEAWYRLDRHTGAANLFNNDGRITLTSQQIQIPSSWWWTSTRTREWHHVALTARADERDRPGGYELFVDGVSVGTAGSAGAAVQGLVYDDARRLRIGEGLPGAVDEIAVYDYVLSRERIAEHVRRAKEGYGRGVPVSTVAPKALGAAIVGRTATCDEGEWTNGPRSFTFQWLRSGAVIPRATEQRYTLSGDDLRHDVTCRVVARNLAGASNAADSSTSVAMPAPAAAGTYGDVVLEDNPRVYLPLDDRSATEAQNLGSDGGAAVVTGNPDTGFYGAVESDPVSDRSYRLDGDDRLELVPDAGASVGKTFTVEAWVNLDHHNVTTSLFNNGAWIGLSSWRTEAYGYWWWAAAGARSWHHVALSVRPAERDRDGEAQLYVDGQPMGASATWLREHGIVYDDLSRLVIGSNLVGAVDEVAVYDYVLSEERIAERVRRAKEGFGAPAPANTVAPKALGDAVVGRVASCDEGTWSGGPRTFTYAWLRDGTKIDRASERTYTLSGDDIGSDISCEVVAHNRTGDSAAVASSTVVAMPRPGATGSYRDAVLRDRPRVYLPLSERTGTSTANLGGDGGDAAIHGNPRMGEFGALESDPLSDRAFTFDGDDKLELRPEAGSTVSREYTVEAWVRMVNYNTTTWLFNNAPGLGLSSWRTEMPATWWWSTVPTRSWQHVAMVVRADQRDRTGSIELFIDGQLAGEHHGDWNPNLHQIVYRDALPLLIGDRLIGGLDEVAIFDYPLSRERIANRVRMAKDGFGEPVPTPVTAPKPLSAAVVGRTATCDEGDWTSGPREFSYRWLRDGQPIAGATERRYVLSATDLGASITCAVVATNAAGVSAEAASTDAIVMPAPSAYTDYRGLVAQDRPVVHLPFTQTDGGVTPNVGLHGGHASLNGDVVRAGSAITGDEDPGVHLDGDDWIMLHPQAGSRVSGDWSVEGWVYLDRYTWDAQLWSGGAYQRLEDWRVFSYHGGFESALQLSGWHHIAMTMRKERDFDQGRVEVFVDGVSRGSAPTTGDWRVYDDESPLYAVWHVSGGIDEMAAYDYVLSKERIDAHYEGGRYGVEQPYPVNTVKPIVSGAARVAAELTCAPGTWTQAPTGYTYQWTRDNSAIPGATASTYTLVAADAGRQIACRVVASNERGTSTPMEAGNIIFVPPLPKLLSSPAVTGKAAPGERVTCAIGGWQYGDTHEVRWELDGAIVTGLPGDQYDITTPDGGRLRCLVQMSGPGGLSDWEPAPMVIVDGTPPTLEVTCPSPWVVRGTSAAATYVASDAASGLVGPASGGVGLDTATAGTKTATFTVSDVAGYTATDSCDYVVVHPRPSAPSPSALASASGLISLGWTIDAESPNPAEYELQTRLDGGAWSTVTRTAARTHSYTTGLGDGRWEFRVRAVDGTFADTWSDISSPVDVDRTAPSVSITCPSATLMRTATAVATYTASDSGSGLATPESGTIALNTDTAGTHTASVTSTDRAGHSTTASCTYRVVHPGPGAPVPSAPASASGLIALTWPIAAGSPETANYELQVQRDGAATWTTIASPTSRSHTLTTPLADGRWRFRVRAIEPTFDPAWSDVSTPVDVDRTPPTVSITCPPMTQTRGAVAEATFTASDGGSGLVTAPAGVITLDTSTAGTHTARVTAEDRAGHRAEATCTYQVVHPRPSAPVPASPASTSGLIALAWDNNGSPNPTRFELQVRRVGTTTWTDIASPTTDSHTLTTPLADGSWRFRVRAVGTDFDTGWSGESITVDVDRTPPTISVTCPSGQLVPGQSAVATFTASDSGSGLATPASGTIPLSTATAGTFTVRVTAEDRAGLTSEATCTYTVLHPKPSAPVPAAPQSTTGLVALTWTLVPASTPNPTRFELEGQREGTSTWTPLASPTTRSHTMTTPLADGTWRFRVRAVDAAFDQSWSDISTPVLVDRTPPTVSITCPSAALMPGDVATAPFTASDATSGLATPASGSITLDTSTAGTFTARVTARDRVGLTTEATCTYVVLYSKPSAPVPVADTSTSGLVSVSWTLPGTTPNPTRFELEAQMEGTTTWTSVASPTTRSHTMTTPLADGTWRFRVRNVGAAYDQSWSAISTPVLVDRTPPTASITCPSAQLMPGDVATASFTASDATSGLATPASGTVALDTSAAGTFTARVTARDRVGLTTEVTCTYVVLHPKPSAPVPAAATSTTGLIALSWTLAGATPNPTRFELEAQREGTTTWTLVGSPTTRSHTLTTPLADGTWRFRVRNVGSTFDQSWSDLSTPVLVDRTPPTASITCPSGNILRGDSATASFTASDTGSGLATPGSGTVALDTATVGTKTATHVARDNLGLTTTVTCTYKVVYHRPGAPVLSSGSNPSSTGVIGLTWPNLDGAEPNPASFELQARDANDAAWTTVASPSTRTHTFTTALASGRWTFRVRSVGTDYDPTWSDVSEVMVVDRGAPNAPIISADRAPEYAGGWYRDSVTVSWAANGDPLLADGTAGTGVNPASVPAPITYSANGTYLPTGSVVDFAGNRSATSSLTIRIDTTDPTLTVTCPAATLQAGSVASATWGASDGQSGLATPASGSTPVPTNAGGDQTLTITARDNVGHVTTRTCAYFVYFPGANYDNRLWENRDNGETRDNLVSPNTVVPIRFNLGGNFGLGVLDGTPTVTQIPCDTRDRNFTPTIPASSADLTWDATNQYTYAFRVQAAWTGTCRQLIMRLDDGQATRFNFRVR